ncbi:uncharacterized protein LOC113316222 [Papaver somniferum]|uniref:uncharacterized protein LOC113316222 n=1 Tax=Papaver somniferum TaxID=3469 RepID=UPI000E6FD6F6|nr:uncharacterized protein LOC113316222 [Papaver somniferum]
MVTPPSSPTKKPDDSPSETPIEPTPKVAINDPYAIHHSDNTSLVLFTPLLNGDNYGIWARGITMALSAKDKMNFINGSILEPEDSNLYARWKRSTNLVKMWITNSIEPDIKSSFMYVDSAYRLWNELHDHFYQSNAPKKFELKHAISTLKIEGMSLSMFFTKMKALWEELDATSMGTTPCICDAGKEIAEHRNRDKVMEFLQGLDDRFANVKSSILLMDPIPSINKVYNLVRQEEKQLHISTSSNVQVESAALFNQRSESKYSKGPANKKPRPFCDHCNMIGHSREKCWKLNGYPPNYVPKSKERQGTMLATSRNEKESSTPKESFTADDYQEYMKFKSFMASKGGDSSVVSSANLAGPYEEDADWSG